jgi:MFS transporter, DHA1 family, inner membrane transport protein
VVWPNGAAVDSFLSPVRAFPLVFFRNSSINLLNLHYGIRWIVETGGGAFYAIYLLKSGVPVPGVFVALALILLGRFVIRPVVIGFAIR